MKQEIFYDTIPLQEAMIDLIKSKTEIADKVTHDGTIDVREENWRGKTFGYPNVRVALLPMVPVGDSCYRNKYTVEWEVIVVSNETSSYETQELVGICLRNLHRKKPSASGFTATPLNVVQINPRVPPPDDVEQKNVWWGSIRFRHEVTFSSA